MQFSAIVDAVRAILPRDWATAPIAYPNEQFHQPGNEPWVYLEVLGAGAESSLFGSAGLRVAREDAVIFAHVFVPQGEGTDGAYAIAQQIGELLRCQTLAPGIETEAPRIGPGERDEENGNTFRVSVSVPVTAHYTA